MGEGGRKKREFASTSQKKKSIQNADWKKLNFAMTSEIITPVAKKAFRRGAPKKLLQYLQFPFKLANVMLPMFYCKAAM